METFKFETVAQYLAAVERPKFGSRHLSYGFTLTHSLDQAIGLARKGWSKGAEKAREYSGRVSETIQTQHVNRGTWKKTFTGGAVRVPAYLQGRPDCFLRYKQVRETKFITLVFVGGASGGVDTDTMITKGALVASTVDLLEARNIRVKVILAYGSAHGFVNDPSSNVGEVYVTLKEHNESVDLDRLAFWLAHPSAMRRIRFAFYETLEDSNVRTAGNGSGHSTDVSFQGDVYVGKSHLSDSTWSSLERSAAYVKQVLAAKGIEL